MARSSVEIYQALHPEPKIVVATGNEKKLRAHTAYPARVESIDPEQDLGHDESDAKDAQAVAWEKTEVIRQELARWWPEGHDYVITANDSITWYAETLEDLHDPTKRRELLKVSRDIRKATTPEEVQRVVEAAALESFEMFCEPVNGQFLVMWELGTAVQYKGVSVTTGIKIIGCFNALPEEEVIQAFNNGTAYDIGPRVQLAELADIFAYDVYIDSNDHRQALQYARLRNLVIEGVMPWSSFQRLLLEANGESPNQSQDKPYTHVPVPFV